MTRGECLWIYPFLTRLKLHKTFLSDQEVSESYKNSYRKLRVCTFRSESLVNMTALIFLGNMSIVFSLARDQISLLATLQKVMVEVYKVLYTRIRDIRLVYYRSGHL